MAEQRDAGGSLAQHVAPSSSSVASGCCVDIGIDFCPRKGPFLHQGCPTCLQAARAGIEGRQVRCPLLPVRPPTCNPNRDWAGRMLLAYRQDDELMCFIPGATQVLLYENIPAGTRECLRAQAEKSGGTQSPLHKTHPEPRDTLSRLDDEQRDVIFCWRVYKKKDVSQHLVDKTLHLKRGSCSALFPGRRA